MAMLAFEINKRQPLAEGRSFGATGAYEHIDGIAHFGIDPAHPDNRGIADIALAPRDPTGLVRFAADVTILTRVSRSAVIVGYCSTYPTHWGGNDVFPGFNGPRIGGKVTLRLYSAASPR
jgi:hypothetical protein